MGEEKMFTEKELETAKAIIQMSGDISTIKDDFKEFKNKLDRISESNQSLASNINLANQKAQEAKIIGETADKKADAALVRVTAIEVRNTAVDNIRKGRGDTFGWFWKAVLALSVVLGIISTAISIYFNIHR